MKRETLESRLEMVAEHLIRGDRCIARLQLVIEKMKRGGHDAGEAERLLHRFREIQASHADSETRLIKELAELRF